MKISQITMLVMFIVIGSTFYFYIKNEKRAESIIEDIKSGQVPINDLRDYEGSNHLGAANFAFGANHVLTVEIHRKRKNEKILKTGGGYFIAILVVFLLVRSYEKKIAPTKLEKLEQKILNSESEYEAEIQYAQNLGLEKRILQIKEREFKKIISELDGLRSKGIISGDEYQQKLIEIKEKFA